MAIVETRVVTGGVDTHADTHVAAALAEGTRWCRDAARHRVRPDAPNDQISISAPSHIPKTACGVRLKFATYLHNILCV